MGNYYAPFSLRVSENTVEKMKVIGERHKRSANKEMEVALEEYIQAYEAANGEIPLSDEKT